MKVAILAGGVGSRLSEETQVKPKPMVEIGGIPVLWHIMMHYACYGHNEFVIGLGYKGEYIKKYMVDYASLNGSLSVNMRTGVIEPYGGGIRPDWKVDLIDTGIPTLTGGRIKRLAPYLGNDTFMLTWGDGVSDVDLDALLAFHRSHGKLATMTAVRPLRASVTLNLRVTRSPTSPKSHKHPKAGSTGHSLSLNRGFSTTLTAMKHNGSANRLNGWRRMAN